MVTRHDSPVPLYVQIKDYIRLNIQNGIYAVNERIPSERQLAEQFGVNRLTVSKALSELTQEGLIYSSVGKGTYVSPAKINQTLQSLTSFTEEMSSRGKTASSRVLYSGIEPASTEVAKALSILPGVEVVVLHRLRVADALPIALEKSHIINALCPDILEKHDFSRKSLYQVLRSEYHLRLNSRASNYRSPHRRGGRARGARCRAVHAHPAHHARDAQRRGAADRIRALILPGRPLQVLHRAAPARLRRNR